VIDVAWRFEMISPALIVFALCTLNFDMIFGGWIAGAWLAPPFAMWLGARHGQKGVRATAIGGLVLVPQWAKIGELLVGGEPVIYLLSLASSWVGLHADRVRHLAGQPLESRAMSIVIAAVLLAPMYGGLSPAGIASEFGARLGWSGMALMPPLALWLGYRGARGTQAALPIAVAALLGWSLLIFQVTTFTAGNAMGRWSIGYGAPQPPVLFAAAIAFATGQDLARRVRGEDISGIWSWWPIVAIALAVLWFGIPKYDWIQVSVRPRVSLAMLGAPMALPLFAFMLGVVDRRRGVVIAALLALIAPLAAVGGSIVFGGELAPLNNLLAVPIAIAWAMAGYYAIHGRKAGLPTLRLFATAPLAVVFAFTVFRVGSIEGLVLAGATILVIMVAAYAARHFRERFEVTADGWLPVFVLLTLIASAVDIVGTMRHNQISLVDLVGDGRGENFPVLLVFVAIAGVLLREFVRGVTALPKVFGDISRVVSGLNRAR
jgi:hypothetical protein